MSDCTPCRSGAKAGYSMHCLPCCARLVERSGPSKDRAAAMLAVIEKYRDAPSREEILAWLETNAMPSADSVKSTKSAKSAKSNNFTTEKNNGR